ncbi:SMI1/KNR4 family protein [Amycolatopsis sp. QT-25]|uniref:SMI1/KNR4 family protein n=1 Tax=Amycolatopsis sp. QT-25 TaxID=3034022 RepID=UPI0023EC8D19|nr:SMI1/KNR4 family protein [Amycolatopsis sp. QT-25]WET76226.1 SMI1/KNR4 family protein [Amycolatopsis sp. QT-25]
MSSTFDLVGEVARGVRDRAGAWRFIQGFAAHWMSPLGQDDGCGEAELTAAEDRLGLRLPAALREAYGLFGRRADLTSNQDELFSPDELDVDEAGEVLVFRVENQGAASWGVPLADLDAADPPVVMRPDLEDKQAESWDAWLDRFSLACVEVVLSESLFSDDELGGHRELTEQDVALLEQLYARLPMPEYPASQTGPGIRWFAGPDLVLREDGRQVLWVRGRTAESFEEVLHALPGEWELL